MGNTIVSFFAPDGTEQEAESNGNLMKSEEAYFSEIYNDLCNSEVSQYHDFNNTDVDDLIIEEIQSRIWATIIKEQGVWVIDQNSGDPETHIDNWIKANPDCVEARTLLWLEA